MKDDVIWGLFVAFATAALFSIGGGSALIPEFHRQLVEVNGYMTSPEFAKSVALAQIAPGPNMLLVSLMGWQVAGLPGLMVSTFAIVVPPSIIAYSTWRTMERLKESRWLHAVKIGLAPLVVALMLASGTITARAADHDAVGYILTVGTAIFMHFTKRNPLWMIATGAIVGLIAHRLGLMTIV
jgi:chromate transporter